MSGVAHIAEDGRRQSVAEHLLQVGKLTGTLAAKLGLAQAGELIGLLHDLGKSTEVFQRYLASFVPESGLKPQDEQRGKIDHSTAGAQMLCQLMAMDASHEFANILALLIVSHHSGLIDCVSPQGEDALAIRLRKSKRDTRVEEAWNTLEEPVRARVQELLQSPALLQGIQRACRRALQIESSGPVADRHHLQLGLMVRLLFSCLIDADRTDTAGFEVPAVNALRQFGGYLPWPVLLQRLEEHMVSMPMDGEVNRIRREVSEACARGAERPAGIYRLTVPTGGGKTLAALRFALKHACFRAPEQPVERVVFVSPYISIVEQNAAVARGVLERAEPCGSVVLEHHSNLGRDTGDTSRKHWRRKLLAENWDAPVVFTTMAQLLDSLFGSGTRGVRRLHTLARAVIIFDEAQTLPIPTLHLFNNAVNYLVRECGSTVLLCTATQPQLHMVDEKHGALRLAAEPELVDDVAGLFRNLRRYQVTDATERPGGWSQSEVADAACQMARESGSCLVILNTKRDVREVFQLCRDQLPGAFVGHLSTGMCPVHRTERLDSLKRRLKQQMQQGGSSEPILCISTNLIEAGVDIDFATAVRDLTGLDSVAQAAGRCNRHGARPAHGRVLIVRLADPPEALVDVLHGRAAARRVLGEWSREHPGELFPLDNPELMDQFFRYLHHERKDEMTFPVRGKNALREDTLLAMLGRNRKAVVEAEAQEVKVNRQLLHQSFMTAAECFQLIAPTQGVIVPYGLGGKEIVSNLCASRDIAAESQLQRQAQSYTISLYDHAMRTLHRQGAVYEVQDGSGVFALHSEWYKDEFGLRAVAGPLEDMIG